MAEWISIDKWPSCVELERPGIVFELRNEEGLTLLSACTAAVPAAQFDWRSPPAEFRPVEEPAPQHSAPIPPPQRR